MRNKIGKILSSPDKGVGRTSGANGVLSSLFRQILFDLSINPSHWSALMHEYIHDPRNGVPNNRRDQTSHRGNLTKEFGRAQMTWKVFMKAMRFLQVVDLELTIKIRRRNKKTTLHTVKVALNNKAIEPEIEDGEDGRED